MSSFSPGNPLTEPTSPQSIAAVPPQLFCPLSTHDNNLLIRHSSAVVLVRGPFCPDSFSGSKPFWVTEPGPVPGDRDWTWRRTGLVGERR